MALWLQIPLAAPTDPVVQSAASAAACSGRKDSTPSSSKPAHANGHQPSKASATPAQAGKLSFPPQGTSQAALV